jgi:3-dehydroquinate synthetase
MLGDKKSASGKINLVLPTRIGHVEIIKDASAEKIARAVESIYA